MKYNIYIPTYGRANKQITFSTLPANLQKKVIFVIRPEESAAFAGYKTLVVKAKGVPAARQAAVEHSPHKAVLFFDDDLRFASRVAGWNYPDNTGLKVSTQAQIEEAVNWMADALDSYAMVGLAARGMNNNIQEHPVRMNYRVMRSFGVRKDTMARHRISFDTFKFWEDFHVALSLLRAGYPNAVNVQHVTDGITNAAGGVSTYRDRTALMRERDRFVAYHAPFVTAVEKKAESWENNSEATMPDVRIAWQKAAKAGGIKC